MMMKQIVLALAMTLVLSCAAQGGTRDQSPSGENVVITPDPAIAEAKGLKKTETTDAAKSLEEAIPVCEEVYADLKKYVEKNPNGVPCVTKCMPTYDKLLMEFKRYADLLVTSASVDFQLTVSPELYAQCDKCLLEAPKMDLNSEKDASWFQMFSYKTLEEIIQHNKMVKGGKA